MIANDKIGQNTTEFDNVIDNILKIVYGMNVHEGNNLIPAKYDLTQLQPIRGIPFLVPPCVIPCYNIIPINKSIRSQDDNFSGFNRLIKTVIKSLFITHS